MATNPCKMTRVTMHMDDSHLHLMAKGFVPYDFFSNELRTTAIKYLYATTNLPL